MKAKIFIDYNDCETCGLKLIDVPDYITDLAKLSLYVDGEYCHLRNKNIYYIPYRHIKDIIVKYENNNNEYITEKVCFEKTSILFEYLGFVYDYNKEMYYLENMERCIIDHFNKKKWDCLSINFKWKCMHDFCELNKAEVYLENTKEIDSYIDDLFKKLDYFINQQYFKFIIPIFLNCKTINTIGEKDN